jgi:hypothetical protein
MRNISYDVTASFLKRLQPFEASEIRLSSHFRL